MPHAECPLPQLRNMVGVVWVKGVGSPTNPRKGNEDAHKPNTVVDVRRSNRIANKSSEGK